MEKRSMKSDPEVENKVIELCEENKDGVNNDMIMNVLPKLTPSVLLAALNNLLKTKLKMFRDGSGTIFYKLKDPVQHLGLKNADNEEKMVYKVVEQSGCHGIFVRKIKSQINLHETTIGRILEKLEKRNLIKSVVNAKKPKQKYYLLASVEPDKDITGGAFYQDNRFDVEFVNVLMDVIHKYMTNRMKTAEANQSSDNPMTALSASKVTVKEILSHIESIGILSKTTKLATDDVEKLLVALRNDGLIESSNIGGAILWRALADWAPTPTLLRTPCGVCPKIEECNEIGDITPSSCRYMEDWLN